MRTIAACLVLFSAFALLACGGDDSGATGGGATGGGGSGGGGSAKSSPSVHPLASLTSERLDEYLEIVKTGGEDAGRTAHERGWKIMDWAMTHAAIRGLVRAGGASAYVDRLRAKVADAEKKLAETEEKLASAPDNQRAWYEKARDSMQRSIKGWKNAISQEDAIRKGGAFIEARMDEVKKTLGL